MERISSSLLLLFSSSTAMISKSELWLWHTVSLLKNSNAEKLGENVGLPNIILNKEQPEFVLFLENETLVQTRMALYRSHGELFLFAMGLPGNTLLRSAYHLLNYCQKRPPRLTSCPSGEACLSQRPPTTMGASSSMGAPFSSLLLSKQRLLTRARLDNQGSTFVMSSLFEVW